MRKFLVIVLITFTVMTPKSFSSDCPTIGVASILSSFCAMLSSEAKSLEQCDFAYEAVILGLKQKGQDSVVSAINLVLGSDYAKKVCTVSCKAAFQTSVNTTFKVINSNLLEQGCYEQAVKVKEFQEKLMQ